MTALGDVGTTIEVLPAIGMKVLLIETPAAFIGGTDTITIDLGLYGCSKVKAIFASSATTTGTVVVAATAGVTGISSGVATIETSATGTNIYGIVIYAY